MEEVEEAEVTSRRLVSTFNVSDLSFRVCGVALMLADWILFASSIETNSVADTAKIELAI